MSAKKLMAELIESKNLESEAEDHRTLVVAKLKGKTVRIERGRSKFFADVEATGLDRIKIINHETGKTYWVYASDVTHIL